MKKNKNFKCKTCPWQSFRFNPLLHKINSRTTFSQNIHKYLKYSKLNNYFWNTSFLYIFVKQHEKNKHIGKKKQKNIWNAFMHASRKNPAHHDYGLKPPDNSLKNKKKGIPLAFWETERITLGKATDNKREEKFMCILKWGCL